MQIVATPQPGKNAEYYQRQTVEVEPTKEFVENEKLCDTVSPLSEHKPHDAIYRAATGQLGICHHPPGNTARAEKGNWQK